MPCQCHRRRAKVNAADADGQTALMDAAGRHHPEIVKLLLKKGADIQAASKMGETALDAAFGKEGIAVLGLLGQKGFEAQASKQQLETVQILRQAGVKPVSSFFTTSLYRGLDEVVIRYTGDVTNEPHLTLTDTTSLILSSNAHMGRFTTLLKWHCSDPVDMAESNRNDLIYSRYQTNRNPFVDHPEWVAAAFIPPLNIALSGQSNVLLSWTNDYAPKMAVEESATLYTSWTTLTNSPIQTNNSFTILIPFFQRFAVLSAQA